MATQAQQQKLEHSPTLNTVFMVENALKNAKESVITVAELKRRLPKQVNHNTLKVILEYLEESNRIAVSLKGITWIHNSNSKLREAILEGKEMIVNKQPKGKIVSLGGALKDLKITAADIEKAKKSLFKGA